MALGYSGVRIIRTKIREKFVRIKRAYELSAHLHKCEFVNAKVVVVRINQGSYYTGSTVVISTYDGAFWFHDIT